MVRHPSSDFGKNKKRQRVRANELNLHLNWLPITRHTRQHLLNNPSKRIGALLAELARSKDTVSWSSLDYENGKRKCRITSSYISTGHLNACMEIQAHVLVHSFLPMANFISVSGPAIHLELAAAVQKFFASKN